MERAKMNDTMAPDVAVAASRESLSDRYRRVRACSSRLCEPLVTEDYVIQSMPDVSPTKWHLAHTSWFFETFLLKPHQPNYKPLHPGYDYLFNSYYVQVGQRHCRPKRGLLSRPTVVEVYRYRDYVDDHMLTLLAALDSNPKAEPVALIELGLNHEQQHQELMLTDIKHVFSCNPLRPAYRQQNGAANTTAPVLSWSAFAGGLCEIGHDGRGFAFDNEGPRHQAFVQAFQLASRLTTNGEYLDFVNDGGYARPELWLSEGWDRVVQERWSAPLYWEQRDGGWWSYTLAGMRPLEAAEPVCHVSYFEADAYARWAGVRLATEQELEIAARGTTVAGNFVESDALHPLPAPRAPDRPLRQLYGDVWEWTRSPYSPYPGYRPPPGAVGEYNGKFMCNQFVLRGGSCATPQSHMRPTYRNFFTPAARWQFSGIRLAQDIAG
jgi:ergothioneine biosynthesis protein EgtB